MTEGAAENSPPSVATRSVDSRIFWTMFYIILATGIANIGGSWWIGATAWASVMGVGLIVFAPAVVWSERRGYHTAARCLFVFAANYFIFAMALGLGHPSQAEAYCFPAMMLGLLLLRRGQTSVWLPLFSMALPVVTWAMIDQQLGFAPVQLPSWLALQTLATVNFAGSFIVNSALLWSFLRHRNAEAKTLSTSLAQAHLSETNLRVVLNADRERKELLDKILQNIPAAVVLRDIQDQMRIVVWSQYTEAMTGIPTDAALGKTTSELFPAAIVAQGKPSDLRAIAHGGCLEEEPIRVKFAHSADHKYVRVRKVPILPDEQGHCRYLLTISDDVTSLKHKEEALVQAERAASERGSKLHSLFHAMSEGMYTVGLDGTAEVCNDAACSILGYAADELVGSQIHDLIHHAHGNEIAHKLADCPLLKSMHDGQVYRSDDDTFWKKDGDSVPVRITSTPLNIGGKRHGSLVTFTDLTQEKRLRQTIDDQRVQMIAVNKLSALGEMAGGIAHEINNPLAVIAGRAGQIKRMVGQEPLNLPKITHGLKQIEETVERIAKIIRGLRTFSRNAEQDAMEEADIRQIVNETLELCRERFNAHGIELRGHIDAGIICECRPTQIAQVLMNLLGNAHDAIEHLSEKWVDLSTVLTAQGLAIHVTDSGRGIPQKTADKIMLPFFTTKDVGKGTGLGLSISKSIIEDHQGALVYDGSCGHTRFIINLPFKQQPNLRLEGSLA